MTFLWRDGSREFSDFFIRSLGTCLPSPLHVSVKLLGDIQIKKIALISKSASAPTLELSHLTQHIISASSKPMP